LIKDPLFWSLPEHSLEKVRKYYWSFIKRNRPEVRKRRRKMALKYKKENYGKFLHSQKRIRKIIKNSVNDFLYSKIKLK